ncbi:MAG: hypothetical protein V4710_02515, partial [Verrucomicrobiota bacterium]
MHADHRSASGADRPGGGPTHGGGGGGALRHSIHPHNANAKANAITALMACHVRLGGGREAVSGEGSEGGTSCMLNFHQRIDFLRQIEVLLG